MDILEQDYGISQIKITGRYLAKRWQYWLKRGYDRWQWAHKVDRYHHLEQFNSDCQDNHCYVYNSTLMGNTVSTAEVLSGGFLNEGGFGGV